MRYVALSIQIVPVSWTLEVDIPWDMPLPELTQRALPMLARRAVPAQASRELDLEPGQFWLLGKYIQGRFCPILTHTLRAAGVYDGNRLVLRKATAPWDAGSPFRYQLVRLMDDGMVRDIERIYLLIPRVRLGRHEWEKGYATDVDLTFYIQSKFISRRHALIMWQNGQFYLRDRGSRNGTWLNGRRLPPKRFVPLQNGDQISFAKRLHFRFVDSALEEQAPPPADER